MSDNSNVAFDDAVNESINSGDTTNENVSNSESDPLYCDEVLPPSPLFDVGRVPKEDKRWSLATHHVRREYGFVWPREKLWIRTTVACSRTGFAFQRKAEKVLKKIWRRKRDSDRLRGMDRFRFTLPVEYGFSIPSDSCGWTLWL
jgi:hypothetical protein